MKKLLNEILLHKKFWEKNEKILWPEKALKGNFCFMKRPIKEILWRKKVFKISIVPSKKSSVEKFSAMKKLKVFKSSNSPESS